MTKPQVLIHRGNYIDAEIDMLHSLHCFYQLSIKSIIVVSQTIVIVVFSHSYLGMTHKMKQLKEKRVQLKTLPSTVPSKPYALTSPTGVSVKLSLRAVKRRTDPIAYLGIPEITSVKRIP